MRMEEKKLPKQALLLTRQGKRPVRRSRKKWMEGVRKEVERRGPKLSKMKRFQHGTEKMKRLSRPRIGDGQGVT